MGSFTSHRLRKIGGRPFRVLLLIGGKSGHRPITSLDLFFFRLKLLHYSTSKLDVSFSLSFQLGWGRRR